MHGMSKFLQTHVVHFLGGPRCGSTEQMQQASENLVWVDDAGHEYRYDLFQDANDKYIYILCCDDGTPITGD